MLASPADTAGWTLDDWLRYQEALHPSAVELGLERVRSVAARLGLLAPAALTITVGGTNGKGSTVALLAGIYRAAGYRVGAYSSPHLYRYNERVQIDGACARDAALCEAFAAIEQARAGVTLTYFEFGTLAALWLFRQAAVDVQVLEVGLGGRLDAVNILDADAAIVTNIGLDHQDWLGDTRDAIGTEKAGIFRPGRIAVCVDADPPQALLDTVEALRPQRFLRFDREDFTATPVDEGHWRYCDATCDLLSPLPALDGAHQLRNAAGALAAVQALQERMPVGEAAIRTALQALRLPGRLEWRGRYLLDVAHNVESAEVLARYLAGHLGGKRCVWLAGILQDKPAAAIAETLRPYLCGAVTLPLEGARGQSAETLAQAIAPVLQPLPVLRANHAAGALALARGGFPADTPILVSGSFHTVAALAPLISHD